MDILKQVIAQKRKQVDELAVDGLAGSKMVRRADLFNREKELYLAKMAKADELQRVKTTDETAVDMNDVLEETSNRTDLSRGEVVRRLRARALPTRLFGESDKDALRRLRKHEMDQPDVNKGWQNEFQSALKKVEDEEMEEIIRGKRAENEAARLDVTLSETAGDATWDQIQTRAAALLDDTDSPNRDCDVVKDFLNYLLKRWGRELNSRPTEVKRTPHGKLAAGRHQQSLEMLRPLMQMLDTYTLNSDIRHHLVNICWLVVGQRDYLRASNCYMEMSIGNAPWPVGVTRSGIHQRPGSSKAYVSNIAHVMNDETQRKYIHGLKRLLTKCQEYFPADPSKCVEYVRPPQPPPRDPSPTPQPAPQMKKEAEQGEEEVEEKKPSLLL